MRKIIISATALIFMTPAVSANQFDEYGACDTLRNVADSVMTERQNGTSKSFVHRSIDQQNPSEAIERILDSIVNAAYRYRQYDTWRDKQDAVEEFRNTIYNKCRNHANE